MSLKLHIHPRILHFKQPAGTSRGQYTERKVWYLELSGTTAYGIGECAPLPALSCDEEAVKIWLNSPENLSVLRESLEEDWRAGKQEATMDGIPVHLPSLRFAVETAFLHLQRKSEALWETPFSRGEAGIRINGLIWMGTYEQMYRQIREKIETGFRCLKLKIGALDLKQEMDLLRYIRSQFSSAELELRVDANGAFSPEKALDTVKQLSELELHSIEQPLQAGHWEEMAILCAHSPLPIALDEELIGVHTLENKEKLLDEIQPQYIVLKPSLHGGIQGTREWISQAQKKGIGWWITSALESNVGLNALAQLCACYQPMVPQGLGTGQLFTKNTPSSLSLKKDVMWFHPKPQESKSELSSIYPFNLY